MGKSKQGKRNNAAASDLPYGRPKSSTVFKFNTDLGQHILKNPGVAEAIVQKANLKPSDTVLEIGPGTGNLTVKILEKAKKVIAVELDPRMAAEVTKRFQGMPEQKRLEVLLGDVIKTELPNFDVCISNTPYQISSPLVFKLLSLPNPPRTSILMFQREFALRLIARPGDSLYCRLSVNAQFWAKITHIMKVGKNNFRPPPQVESSVVRIEPKLHNERPRVSWEEWDGMLRICFIRKNKTLRASWLGSKKVLAMCEKNFRVWCALNNVLIDKGGNKVEDRDDRQDIDVSGGIQRVPNEEEWDSMDVDTARDADEGDNSKTESGGKTTGVAKLVKEKIRKVLEVVTELADKRAGQCDEGDFLKLLLAFNEEGIHFA